MNRVRSFSAVANRQFSLRTVANRHEPSRGVSATDWKCWKSWWALKGSNLRPLPCEGHTPSLNLLGFSALSETFRSFSAPEAAR
jgi:hypothetical protein